MCSLSLRVTLANEHLHWLEPFDCLLYPQLIWRYLISTNLESYSLCLYHFPSPSSPPPFCLDYLFQLQKFSEDSSDQIVLNFIVMFNFILSLNFN